ncbi:histidine--tRNA ligase [Mesomycoplasma conjunctivae]|uniref:histidine--tRNA ligase n=1 Tax=Mesomycoplasma conjunctivae TaxID=45361 RepID=UPI003DA1E807
MKNINIRPKGTYDLYGQRANLFLEIRDKIFLVSNLFNYKYIETPIFEFSEVFFTSGDESDLVSKELYEFKDKSNRSLSLRAEGTAPVMRALVENKIYLENKKYFYFGPMFRYENPQKGRNRQFYQAGFEFINLSEDSRSSAYEKIEVLLLAIKMLKELNFSNYKIKINFLASRSTRKKYILALKQYFLKYSSQLSSTSQQRLAKNPLRILDDKIDAEKEFVKNAPKINAFYTPEEQEEFNFINKLLKSNQIEFEIDYNLVRGLDYYDNLVFEFIADSPFLGTKSTILGGGCYNNLIANFGMPAAKGIGFGFGVDRFLEIQLPNYKKEHQIDFYCLSFNFAELEKLNEIARILRDNNYIVEFNKKPTSFTKGFKKALKTKTKYLLFFEKNQIENTITCKKIETNENKVFNISDLSNLKNFNF